MRKILIVAFFALLASFMDAQTFTFECFCGDLSGVRCDICTGQTQTRFFCGLLIKKSGTVVKWIDAPYIIQWQGNNAIIREIIPNPETFTINISGTSFANLAAFKAALECPCNVPGKLFYISDITRTTKVMRNDTVTIVGSGGATVTLDTTNQKFTVSAATAAAQVLSATGSGPTKYNIALSGGGGAISLKEGATGIDLSRLNDTITINNTAPDRTVSISGAGINVVTGAYPNFTITGTEIDGNVSNEGSLTVGAGTSTTSIINSNTSGSTGVTITAAGINTISEAGNIITITGTEVDGSITNELQTLSVASNTATLSSSGGSVTIAGAGINSVSTSGTTITVTGTEVDGNTANEGLLGVGAGSGTSSVLLSNTTGATGVTINAGGINTISETTSANGGQITITATEVDGSVSNELQTYGHAGTTTYTNTLSNSGGSFSITGAGINVVSQTSGAVTVTATEVDGSTTNELQNLSLTGQALGISSGTGVTLPVVNVSAGTGISVSAASGNYAITNTGDLSNTNELQTIANTSDATSHTVTLSSSGGSVQLAEGSNITLTTTGTGLAGIVTIATTGLGNGIYGGSGSLPTGGSVVTTGGYPLGFTTNTSSGVSRTILNMSTPYSADDAFTIWLRGKSPNDTLLLYNYNQEGYITNEKNFYLKSNDILTVSGDSIVAITVPAITKMPSVMGITAGGTMKKIVGTSNGQALLWNAGGWAPGTVGGGNGIYGGSGTIPWNVVPTITNTITFTATDTAGGKVPFNIVSTGNDPEIQKWVGNNGSVIIRQNDSDYDFSSDKVFGLTSTEYTYMQADSCLLNTVGAVNKFSAVLGTTPIGTVKKVVGSSAGQALLWDGSFWAPGTAGGGGVTGSGTANYVAYWSSGSAITGGANFQFDGTRVGIGGAPVTGFGLYSTTATRVDGTGFFRGTGKFTDDLGSPHIRMYNTTPSTGDTWYVGSENNGSFDIISSNLGDTLLSINSTGDLAYYTTPNSSVSLRIGNNKPLGIPLGITANRNTTKIPGLWSNTTLRVIEGKIDSAAAPFKTILSYGSPTTTKQVGMGSTGTVTKLPYSNDKAGQLTLIVSGTGIAAGSLVNVAYVGTYASVPFVSLTARNAAAAGQSTNFFIGTQTTSNFTINVNTALAPNTYVLNYQTQQ